MGVRQVRAHYEDWPFPGMEFWSRESLLLLKYLGQWLREDDRAVAKVIDVGCGTGHTTLALARRFPEVSFLGLDISRNSLAIARRRARQFKVPNVRFANADIRKDMVSFGQFRVVISTGVLHHLENLRDSFSQVAQLVEDRGYLVVWLYGRHGRAKHQLNQQFLRLVTKEATKQQMFLATRIFLEHLGKTYAKDSGFYTPKGSGEDGLAWLLNNPQWLADQMIPAFEQSVTMPDILDLFKKNRLCLVKWFGVSLDLRSYTTSRVLLRLFQKLPFEEKLTALDCLIKPEYYFVAGQKQEAKEKSR